MNSLAILGFISASISAISLVAAFLFAISKLGRIGRPARWLLLGIGLWLVAAISSPIIMIFLSRVLSPAEIGRYSLVVGIMQACVHALGLAFVVHAVFVDRPETGAARIRQGDDLVGHEFNPQSDNPFSTPQAS